MKKSVRNLLIMAAVLIVLGGAAALLRLLPGADADGTSSLSSPAETSSAVQENIMDTKTEDVSAISVKNSQDSFTFVPQGEDFTLKDYEDCELNTASIASSVQSLVTMPASKNLGIRDNLEDFGLAGENAVEVEVTGKDGSAQKLVLGNAAGESTGRYVLKDNTVYIAANVADLLYGSKFGYFSTFLYSVEDRTRTVTDENGSQSIETLADILYSVKLSGSNFPEEIEIEYNEDATSVFYMTKPVKAESGSTGFENMTAALKAPTATEVVAAHLTEETLEEYGLTEPFAKVEFKLNEDSHTMTVSGAGLDGSRYLQLDDRDMIYKVSGSAVADWAETNVLKQRMSYICLPNIKNVSSLSLTVNGDMAYGFTATRTVNEEKSTEDSTEYDLSIKNAGGREIEYETYRSLYQDLISVAVLSTDREEYNGAPLLRVEYEYFDGSAGNTVEFYAIENDRCVALLDGEFNGVVRKTEVDKVVSQLAKSNG